MGIIYWQLKRAFSFLNRVYGLEISSCQKSGAYYYIEYENNNARIMVIYDLRENDPMRILVHDKNTAKTIVDATEYVKELSCGHKRAAQKIEYAANWLKDSICQNQIKL